MVRQFHGSVFVGEAGVDVPEHGLGSSMDSLGIRQGDNETERPLLPDAGITEDVNGDWTRCVS